MDMDRVGSTTMETMMDFLFSFQRLPNKRVQFNLNLLEEICDCRRNVYQNQRLRQRDSLTVLVQAKQSDGQIVNLPVEGLGAKQSLLCQALLVEDQVSITALAVFWEHTKNPLQNVRVNILRTNDILICYGCKIETVRRGVYTFTQFDVKSYLEIQRLLNNARK